MPISPESETPKFDRLRIIILNYNRAKLTLKCLSSVLGQSYPLLDIVVVDNNSRISEYSSLAGNLPPSVILLKTDRNRGYAAGNNVGAEFGGLPEPKYLMILNNDVELPDIYICRKLVQAIVEHDGCVASSPLVDTTTTGAEVTRQNQVRRLPDFWMLLISCSWWLRRIPGCRGIAERYVYSDRIPWARSGVSIVDSINGSCFVIDHAFFKSQGFFDEATFLYEEEIILAHQLRTAKKKACVVGSAVVLHEQGATSGQNRGEVRLKLARHMVQSQIHYVRKYLRRGVLYVWILMVVRLVDIWTKIVLQTAQKFYRWLLKR
jgi:GT2 family glycosyltransferase